MFIAQRESAVSTITFIINQNNKFTETSACFGITETKGDYALKGDTLFFTNVHTRPKNSKKYYKFAIINRLDTTFSELGKIVRYQNCLDTIRHELCITKDDLKNDNSEK